MKKLLSLLVLCICFELSAQAQATISFVGTEATVSGATAGCLVGNTLNWTVSKGSITKLTVYGVIDASDFLVIRDEMGRPGTIASINLSGTSIAQYIGTQGTNGGGSQTYPANTVPISALRDIYQPVTISLPSTATAIGDEAFYKNNSMTSISMPTNLTSIGTGAFVQCESLTSITLPSSLTSIGSGAFKDCINLNTINSYSQAPNTIILGTNVFSGVPTSTCVLKVPSGRSVIYSGTAQWNSFTNIYAILGATINIIGTEATITGSVAGCLVGNGLMNATQKQTMTTLTISGVIDASDFKVIRDEMAQYGVLTSIDLSGASISAYTGTLGTNGTANQTYPANTVPISGLRDIQQPITIALPATATAIGNEAFYKNSFMTSIIMPTNLSTIGDEAFRQCYSLTALSLPASLTSIGLKAFVDCGGLTVISSYSSTPNAIILGLDIFNGVPTTTCVLKVPVGTTTAYSSLAQWVSFTNISPVLVVGTASVSISGNGTIATITGATPGCLVGYVLMSLAQKQAVNTLTISGYIDASDFAIMREEMIALTDVNLEASKIVSYTGTQGTSSVIQNYLADVVPIAAFKGRISIVSIIIPSTTTVIDAQSFAGCESLTTITMPNSVIGINDAAFEGCYALVSVDLPTSLTAISEDLFLKCSSLTTLTIHNSVQVIKPRAFYQTALTSIIIPPSVKEIYGYAFAKCDQLTSVTFSEPDNSALSFIGTYAFERCANLQSIEIPTNVTLIEPFAFSYSGLVSVTFSDPIASKLEWIESDAFSDCTNLKALTLPYKLLGIKDRAFAECTHLETIYAYNQNPNTNIAGNTFLNVPLNTCIMRVGESKLASFVSASVWDIFVNKVEGFIPPTVNAVKIFRVGTQNATSYNEIISMGDISSVELGVTWGTSEHPVADGNPYTIEGSAITPGLYELSLKNLSPGTTYYVRPFLVNTSTKLYAGATYGNEISFTTPTLVINGTTATITGMTAGALEKEYLLDQSQKDMIETLIITGTINKIDFDALRSMPALKHIDLSGATISEYDANYPANVIPESAFRDSPEFLSFILPANTTTIKSDAFTNCSNLTSVSLPSTLTEINNYVFSGCGSLQVVEAHFPNPIDISGRDAFSGVDINSCVLHVPGGTLDVYYNTPDWKEFSHIVEGFTPPTLTSQAASSITATTAIGNGTITSFGDVTPIQHGFVWSTSSNPTVGLSTKTELGASGSTGAFTSNITGLSAGTTYYARAYASVPAYPSEAGATYGDEISFTTAPTVTIGGTVATITSATPGCMNGTFTLSASQKSTMTRLILSGTIDARDIKVIRDTMPALNVIDLSGATIAAYTGTEGTFSTNSRLYPQNELPALAFNGRTGFTSVTLSSSVKSIGDYAYQGCTGLTTTSLPSTLDAIGIGAFSGCSSLTSITIPSTVTLINIVAFSGCSKLTSISMPPSVTTLGQQAFQNCTELTSATLPSNLTSIPLSLFNGCSKLNNIVIPPSVTSIGGSAFLLCSSLTSISIPTAVTTIGSNAFMNCTSLTSIVIPTAVTTIYTSAFKGCTKLVSASIPASVTYIGSNVFNGDVLLTTIDVHTTTPINISGSSAVFTSVPFSTCVLRVPSGSTGLYQAANQWTSFVNIVEGFVPPTLTTQATNSITTTTATGNGTITNIGDQTAIQYGVVWSTSPNPTVSLSTKSEQGPPSGTGAYTSPITNLTANTTYFVRAYASNKSTSTSYGTVYGNETSFTTNKTKLTVIVPPAIVLSKIYDGYPTAALTNFGTLDGIATADKPFVDISATAAYLDATIGTGKRITVTYSITGGAASNYIKPDDYIVYTGEIDKELKLYVLLEGFWNITNGNMNQCKKANLTPMYGSNITDLITVELHNPASYSSVLYTFSDLELHQDGSVTSAGKTGIALPPSLTGTYTIAVKTRNHLETASASGIPFSAISTTYDFRDVEGKSYVSSSLFKPVKQISGKWMFYAGDPKKDTYYPEINFDDLYYIFNNKSGVTGVYGYLPQDIDGDGDVTDADLYLMFNNRDALLYIP